MVKTCFGARLTLSYTRGRTRNAPKQLAASSVRRESSNGTPERGANLGSLPKHRLIAAYFLSRCRRETTKL